VSTDDWPTPDELEEIFRNQIIPDVLTGAVPQENPVAILLAGQPGAGKSSSKGALHQELADFGGAVDFSADLMRPYHPKFVDLLQGDERLLGDLDAAIGRDVRKWVDEALAYSIDRRVNVIFDSNLADHVRAGKIVDQFADASYETIANFIATAPPVSELGVIDRLQRQIEAEGVGAYCPKVIQVRNKLGMLDTAGRIDTGEIRVDGSNVYRRGGGDPIYTHRLGELGGGINGPGTRQAIVDEWNRPLSEAESSWFIETAESLAVRITDEYRDDLRETVESADSLLRPEHRQRARELVLRLAETTHPSPTKGAATAGPAPSTDIPRSPAQLSFPPGRVKPAPPRQGGEQRPVTPPPGPQLGQGPTSSR
jgi:hypothetical protein